METLWFCLVAIMIAAYVVLDGYDLGAGIVHLGVARTDAERNQVLQSIGPFWDGNEVWLLAGGGTLYFAFPALYSSSFSGFYLPLMMVLWLLILRGISIEFRNHIENPVWKPLWDTVFCLASAVLAIFFGAALGNVIRGVPLSASGEFFLPLWTNFGVKGDVGILDWYTVPVGLLAFVTLTEHGALWVAYRTEGDLHRRARHVASVAWWLILLLTIVVTIFTFQIQPQIAANLRNHPWGFVFPLLAIAGLVLSRTRADGTAFVASCAYIVGMLTSAAFGVFPYVLPSSIDPGSGLTIYNAAAPQTGLHIGLVWWIPGMLLASAYSIYLHRHFSGKVTP